VLLTIGGLIFVLNVGAQAVPVRPHGTDALTLGARMSKDFGNQTLNLPAATAPPAPSPPALAAIPNLPAHEVFGFAPYWTLANEPGFEVQNLSTIAYFGLGVNNDGSIAESGPGWDGYQSQDLVDLVNRAHSADDRVVLTITCFDQGALDQLTSNTQAPTRLASELTGLVSAKSLDGVNIDFEGNGPQDRQGLDGFVSSLSSQLRAANPHWQITMDTYASSAGDPGGFYDIAGLAPSVDGFFVMAYDMYDASVPSANAPLSGQGDTDTSALQQYLSVVPASKVILGVPAYGYDWPTSGPALGAAATGSPSPVSYAQIVSMGSPVYWDPTTQTPWTAYQSGSQWHQVFFDNPTSIALKARLAELAHVAGVGIWALGMDGNDPAMTQALLGSARAVKYQQGPTQPAASPSAAPSSASGSSPGGSSSAPGSSTTSTTAAYHYRGAWNGHEEELQPADASSLPGGGAGTDAGQLTGFQTDNPAFACLSSGPALTVTELSADPSEYVVSASKPGDCADGTWTFEAAPGSTGSQPPSTPTPSSPLPGLPGGLGSAGATRNDDLP